MSEIAEKREYLFVVKSQDYTQCLENKELRTGNLKEREINEETGETIHDHDKDDWIHWKNVPEVSKTLNLDDAAHFISLLMTSPKFCHYVSKEWLKLKNTESNSPQVVHLTLNLTFPTKPKIDYNWDKRIQVLVNENCELQNAMAWLSTLGGGYSSLGDCEVSCAEKAEKISYKQLQLAMKQGDPATISRCHIYTAISLLQRNYLKAAKQLILKEYEFAKSQVEDGDNRLPKMCKGVWSRLQYLYSLKKANKQRGKNGTSNNDANILK